MAQLTLEEFVKKFQEADKAVYDHYALRPQVKCNGYYQYDYGSEEDKTWQEEHTKLQDNLNQLKDHFSHRKDRLILIKNPGKIIGGRTVQGYGGKLCSFDVSDLKHIELSEVKEEGDVKMPYKIDLQGNAKRTSKSYYYRIKRTDGKVYWRVAEADLTTILK